MDNHDIDLFFQWYLSCFPTAKGLLSLYGVYGLFFPLWNAVPQMHSVGVFMYIGSAQGFCYIAFHSGRGWMGGWVKGLMFCSLSPANYYPFLSLLSVSGRFDSSLRQNKERASRKCRRVVRGITGDRKASYCYFAAKGFAYSTQLSTRGHLQIERIMEPFCLVAHTCSSSLEFLL